MVKYYKFDYWFLINGVKETEDAQMYLYVSDHKLNPTNVKDAIKAIKKATLDMHPEVIELRHVEISKEAHDELIK